mgnify:FL=1|tara:strand:- start:1431 stop:2870 length:1440 start_codon:yes stop_codon:yes gene_type:complete
MAATITSDLELEAEVAALAGGTQGNVPQVKTVKMGETVPTVIPNTQLQGTDDALVGKVGDVDKLSATDAADSSVTKPVRSEVNKDVGQIDKIESNVDATTGKIAATDMVANKIANTTTDADGNTVPVEYVDMTGVEGAASTSSIASAAVSESETGEAVLDKAASVKFQIGELMASLEEGKPMPPWAAPQVRKVAAVMQARGMGASSMASAAMMQALMESGIPIATADANSYAKVQLNNLNNKQQTALQNAATYAAMDKANLNARLTAAVTNAQSLLAVDTANLNASQATDALNYNALTTALLTDTAAENLKLSINAKNEQQSEEFFAELGSQIETANANRTVAVNQFNEGETNAMNQFNTTVDDARDKFDATMSFAIDQSNVNWRRSVNTADTAVANETNRINTQNLYNMTTTALNALWQKYRDNASWNFSKSESAEQRAHEIGIMAMEFANSKETYTQEQKDNIGLAVGNWLATWAAE